MLFFSCFCRLARLPNADLTTFTGYTVDNWSLQSQVVLLRAKKAGDLGWPSNRFNVVSVEHPANVVEGYTDVRWSRNRGWILPRLFGR